MATNKELLIETRNNLIAQRAEISREKKPTYSVDGQTVQWESYMKMLTEQIAALKTEIDSEDDDDIYEFESYAI